MGRARGVAAMLSTLYSVYHTGLLVCYGAPSPVTEYLPLRDFYHRHTRSIFWELQDMLPAAIGNNVVFRNVFGWLIPPKVSFLKLVQPESMRLWYEKRHVIQDMLVPVNTLADSLQVFRDQYDLYPLWICPMRLPANIPGFVHPRNAPGQEDMFVDIGAYGIPKSAWNGTFNAKESGVAVESHVRKVGGFQMLYADVYLSKQHFEEMFDHPCLNECRKKYKAEGAFLTPYEKMVKKAPK